MVSISVSLKNKLNGIFWIDNIAWELLRWLFCIILLLIVCRIIKLTMECYQREMRRKRQLNFWMTIKVRYHKGKVDFLGIKRPERQDSGSKIENKNYWLEYTGKKAGLIRLLMCQLYRNNFNFIQKLNSKWMKKSESSSSRLRPSLLRIWPFGILIWSQLKMNLI